MSHGVSDQDPIVISDSDDEVVTIIPKTSNNHHAHAQPLQPPSIRSARDKRKPAYHQSQQLGSPSSVPLTWYQLRRYASDRLRPINCLWRNCDAVLADPDLLRRHVQVHCAQAIPIAAMRRRKGGFADAGCEWNKCEEFGFYNSQSLAGHVIKEHIDPLISSWCPFAGCSYTSPSSRALSVHAECSHKTPWTLSLLPRPFSSRLPPLPPRILPKKIPTFLLSPVRPTWFKSLTKSDEPSRRKVRSRSQSQSPPLSREAIKMLIFSRRDDDVPFLPIGLREETDVGSSSTFPPDQQDFDLARSGQAYHIMSIFPDSVPDPPLSSASTGPNRITKAWRRRYSPLSLVFQPRSISSCVPQVTRQAADMNSGRDRRRNRTLRPADDDDLFSLERIRRAAKKYAMRKSGRVLGVDFLEHVRDFEACGRRWGELF
ncbi:hypothetical protein TREMEDRAFT_74998 [Tremella mesenterica DSM 1558]|uniref:uncharacterized protein n=1 Tax=Tremella mesenterica (strain ATCC 24925 / CBS 8224 / DSM 1558 / NBRC 9311 / NRRL Y-6157 / RJB 2259-6 / UBC 559-6) TaxID=578456 RepID=UPI00032D3D5F|nr:uncharacterized protein TREMEDRAFT_74998 [Tremella mesenterica DSM 1558]EIW65476.1 hypothetical protein TREMEDRAFT_74998 [Tremella mesenterica DSM 1558]